MAARPLPPPLPSSCCHPPHPPPTPHPCPPGQTVRRLLKSDWWTGRVSATPAQLQGAAGSGGPGLRFRGFYGKYAYSATAASGQTFNGVVNMRAASGGSQTVTVTLPL